MAKFYSIAKTNDDQILLLGQINNSFNGNEFDVRGYSSAKKFCKKITSKSKTNESK